MDSRRAGDDCNEEWNYPCGHNLVCFEGAICNRNPVLWQARFVRFLCRPGGLNFATREELRRTV